MTDPLIDPLTERLTAAAERAMRGVELHDPGEDLGVAPGDPVPETRGHRRRWMTVSASLLAASVVGLVVWAAVQVGPNTEPADPATEPAPSTAPPTEARTAIDALDAALDASLAEPAWSAEVTSAAGETFWTYEAPDRMEMRMAGPTGQWEPASVTVGTDMYVFEQGEWTLQQQDWRTSAVLNLLEGLNSVECAAWEGEAIVYWFRPTGDCGAPPGDVPEDLPATSEVGRIELDGSGRVRSLRAGEVLAVNDQRAIRPDPDAESLLERVGATGGATASFRYDDVPPVTVPATG